MKDPADVIAYWTARAKAPTRYICKDCRKTCRGDDTEFVQCLSCGGECQPMVEWVRERLRLQSEEQGG